MTGDRVLITCEHGGNRIPAEYRRHFLGHEAALNSHLGYDPGALALARDLSRACRAPLIHSTTSRLLIELNRSPGHPRLYSWVTRSLTDDEKQALLRRHYLPYRTNVENFVASAVRMRRRVVHIASHSFTPVLDAVRRRADVGLLYDPSRSAERRLCTAWQAALRARLPALTVRRNYPYRGVADGLTTYLRRRFPPGRYLGIEVEINQKHALGDRRRWAAVRQAIGDALRTALEHDA